MKANYLDPFTDFKFKRLFGQEASKPLLRDFLNAPLPPAAQIRELAFFSKRVLCRASQPL